jgi:PAS domain S-box-containing protein
MKERSGKVSPGPEKSSERSPAVPRPADWMFLQPSVLDEMHDAVIVTDLDGIVTGCNRAAIALYGYTANELIGQDIATFYSVEEQHIFREQVLPSVLTTGTFRGEVRNRTHSGDYVYVHLAVSLLRDGDGKPAGMVGFSVDVTGQKLGHIALRRNDDMEREREATQRRGSLQGIAERRQAEADLRRTLERKQLGMQVAALALSEIDYTTGLNHLSAEAARMFGLGDDAMVLPRGSVHATFHPGDREELVQRINGCLDPAGIGWFAMEHRVVWPSGEVRWLRVRKKIFFEGEGASRKPISGILAAIDVTVEKNATEEIQQSEIRFRTMTESLPQMIWTSDAKGKKLFCNQKYLRYLGIPSSDMAALRFEEFLHPDDRLAATETWERCIATGEPYLKEYRMRRHDGVYRHFIARVLPSVNEHGVIDRWLGSITDVHDQKLAEEALRRTEKLATAGRLAASIAHEINNPLAAVTNSIYLALQDNTLNSTTRSFLRMADEELARVAHITTQSLKFHKQSISPELANLGEVMRSAMALFEPRFKSKQLRIQIEIEAGASAWCLRDDVRQVFTNLLSNALDATREQGRIRIRVKHSYTSDGSGVPGVRIVIGDTGIGVPAVIRARIFEPFVSTKLETGIGLGLWISEAIIKKHRGRVQFRSRTDPRKHGTVVSLFFPADGLSDWRVPTAPVSTPAFGKRKN